MIKFSNFKYNIDEPVQLQENDRLSEYRARKDPVGIMFLR